MTLFHIGFIPFTIWDLLDVMLVGTLYYQLLRLVRGTRASAMVMGLVLLLLISFVVRILNLSIMSVIFQNFATIWVISLVIIFHPELRRFLIQLGQTNFLRRLFNISEEAPINEIVNAAKALSQRRYGGLFVIIREVGLKMINETGVPIDATVKAPLLISIFFPRTPLHDGAVMIERNRIVAAKCTLPISRNTKYESILGTRHRAALGISEESDAVTVIVSEETGRISLALAGDFIQVANVEQLHQYLTELLTGEGVLSPSTRMQQA